MKCSDELIYWMKSPDENFAKKKILSDDDWSERTIKDVERIINNLKITHTDSVLDFGCGIGRLTKEIAPLCDKIYAVDVSDNMLSLLMNYCGGISNVFISPMQSEMNICLMDKQVDKIFSLLVLQHIEKPNALEILKEFKRVLKPKGKLFLQYPNSLNKDFYFKYMKTKSELGINPLVEFYSEDELKMIFKEVGLNIIKIDNDGHDFWVLAMKPEEKNVVKA